MRSIGQDKLKSCHLTCFVPSKGKPQSSVFLRILVVVVVVVVVVSGSSSLVVKNKNYMYIWVYPKIGVPQIGWFLMENPSKMYDLGVPLFSATRIYEQHNHKHPRQR